MHHSDITADCIPQGINKSAKTLTTQQKVVSTAFREQHRRLHKRTLCESRVCPVICFWLLQGDDYNHIMVEAIADRLAEAFAEKLHEIVRKEVWAYAPDENMSADDLLKVKYQGRAPLDYTTSTWGPVSI